jgi:nicotinamide riboside kinase
MSKAITISIVGAPHSGKSTLASQINSILKTRDLNSIYVGEYVEEYVAKYGVPTSMEQQQIIYREQFEKERMFSEIKDFVICDTASWLSYIYSRQYFTSPLDKQQIKALNALQYDVLSNIDYWTHTIYVPILDGYKDDGIRHNSETDARVLDKMIKGFLDLERVPYVDLSDVSLDSRIEKVIETILK